MAAPNRLNFWKRSKGGEGGIFNQKIYVAVFAPFYRAFHLEERGDFGTFKKIVRFGFATHPLVQG